MTGAAPRGIAVARELDRVMREDRGRLVAALIARLGDFQLAEEALQEAALSAMTHWGQSGLPQSPQGWLLRVALRKAIDRLRRAARDERREADLARLARDEADDTTPEAIADERLRLIFACCHPVLEPKSRVALTLRTLGGLTTGEIARVFLDAEPTMGQRLSRAKARIAQAGVPFAVPEPEEMAERLASVLTVIYLIYTAGHGAGAGLQLTRVDLCEEAVWLARMVVDLADPALPETAEALGLMSLVLTTQARAGARADAEGAMVPLDAQDRALWDRAMIAEGLACLDRALALGAAGPFQIKAAISALHVQAESHAATDWRQVVLLYTALLQHEPTDVVRLNRAVALAQVAGPEAALRLIDQLGGGLEGYQPYHAARADLLARSGAAEAAVAAYGAAIGLSASEAERRFLEERRGRLLA
jgi:RNA polymerase sigma-70 factor (ECF subfamily)